MAKSEKQIWYGQLSNNDKINYWKTCFDPIEWDHHKAGDKARLVWSNNRPRWHFQTDKAWQQYKNTRAGQDAGGTEFTDIEKKRERGEYARISFYGIKEYAHIILFAINAGRMPLDECHIDHVDRDRLNNRFGNIREVSIKENMNNRKSNVGRETLRKPVLAKGSGQTRILEVDQVERRAVVPTLDPMREKQISQWVARMEYENTLIDKIIDANIHFKEQIIVGKHNRLEQSRRIDNDMRRKGESDFDEPLIGVRINGNTEVLLADGYARFQTAKDNGIGYVPMMILTVENEKIAKLEVAGISAKANDRPKSQITKADTWQFVYEKLLADEQRKGNDKQWTNSHLGRYFGIHYKTVEKMRGVINWHQRRGTTPTGIWAFDKMKKDRVESSGIEDNFNEKITEVRKKAKQDAKESDFKAIIKDSDLLAVYLKEAGISIETIKQAAIKMDLDSYDADELSEDKRMFYRVEEGTDKDIEDGRAVVPTLALLEESKDSIRVPIGAMKRKAAQREKRKRLQSMIEKATDRKYSKKLVFDDVDCEAVVPTLDLF